MKKTGRQDPQTDATGGPLLAFLAHDVGYFLSHRLPVALAAREAGYRIAVIAPGATRSAELADLGFEVHHLVFRRGSRNPVAELEAALALHGLLRRLRPDICHAVALKLVLYAGVSCRLLGLRAVLALTGLGFVFTETSPGAWAIRRAVGALLGFGARNRRACVVLQNPDDARLLRDEGILRGGRYEIIRGAGVDTDAFTSVPAPPTPPVTVVLPARLLRHKGVMEFVDAARLLSADAVAVRLRVAGSPDPENPSAVDEATIEAWQREGIVEFLGHRRDMATVYRENHIVCLPSYREGLPKALLEAAACGRPLIAADVPGCREVVRPGENGLLVPVRDAGALADAIRALADDPDRREQFGRASREIAVRDFRVERIATETVALYDALTAR
ncbi:MAG: glycosyltransferase family 4 protein [Azospirillaceae bacterium]